MKKISEFNICVDLQEFLTKYLCAFYVLESMTDTELYNVLFELGNEIIKENKNLIKEINSNCNLNIKTEKEIVTLAFTLCNYITD